MLNFFASGELPGPDESPYASRDMTSFYDIWQAARKVETTCLVGSGKPGWAAPQGKHIALSGGTLLLLAILFIVRDCCNADYGQVQETR